MLARKIVNKNSMLNDTKLNFIAKVTENLVKKNVVGDIVECGVWQGGCSAMIADILLTAKVYKQIRLFDSFDDPPEPLPIDGKFLISRLAAENRATGRLKPIKGFYKKVTHGIGPGKQKNVKKLLIKTVGYPKEKINIYKGWFQHTLKENCEEISKVALLIIDCGLYASTKVCLDYLYEKVIIGGGVIIIDDYYSLQGCKYAVDEFINYKKLDINVKRVGKTACVYLEL